MMRPLVTSLLLALVLIAGAASADDVTRARELGSEGLALFNKGQFAAAYEKLAEANRLHSAPTLLLYMARAKREQNKLVEARQLYEELVAQKLPPDASVPFREAKDTAFRELTELDKRIPAVLVTVEGVDEARVTVDGAPAERIEQPIRLDPGRHEIVASSARGEARKVVTLDEGSGVVPIALRIDGAAPAEAPVDEPTGPVGGGSGLLAGAMAAFAVGAAGLGVGIGTGVVAMNKANDVKSRCTPDNHCLAADAETGKTASTLANVSTAGFVVAGVGIAAGIVLLVIPTADDETAIHIGPSGFAVSGRF